MNHGVISTYKHKGCRCAPCTAANTLAMNHYRSGRYSHDLVSAQYARKHAKWLVRSESGKGRDQCRWTYRTLSAHVGMDRRSFARMMRGEYKRVSRKYSDRILATPDRRFFLELLLRKKSA